MSRRLKKVGSQPASSATNLAPRTRNGASFADSTVQEPRRAAVRAYWRHYAALRRSRMTHGGTSKALPRKRLFGSRSQHPRASLARFRWGCGLDQSSRRRNQRTPKAASGIRRKYVVAIPAFGWFQATDRPSRPTEMPRYSSSRLDEFGCCGRPVTCTFRPIATGPRAPTCRARANSWYADVHDPPQQRRSRQTTTRRPSGANVISGWSRWSTIPGGLSDTSTGADQRAPPSTLVATRMRETFPPRWSAQARARCPARRRFGSAASELIASLSSVGDDDRVMPAAATTRRNVAPPSRDEATTYDVGSAWPVGNGLCPDA